MDHHDHASFSEKVRGAFEELDMGKQRGIKPEDWCEVMTRLRVGFAAQLFETADANHDGVVSFTEFQRFAEHYPTLLDSIYYRSKDYYTDVTQIADMEESRKLLKDLQDREQQAGQILQESVVERTCQEAALAEADQGVNAAKANEEDAKHRLAQAQANTADARARVTERTAELQSTKDEERNRGAVVADAQARVLQLTEAYKLHEIEVAQAEDRLRGIERMLMEQKREVEARMASQELAKAEIAQAQGMERIAISNLNDAQAIVENAKVAVAQSEDDAKVMQEHEREAHHGLTAASSDVMKAIHAKEAEFRDYQIALEKESQNALAQGTARAATEAQAQVIHELEMRNAEFNQHRVAVEQEESPLLEQEAMLRAQRSSLEDREAKLRSDAQAFAANTARSPVTSPRYRQPIQQLQHNPSPALAPTLAPALIPATHSPAFPRAGVKAEPYPISPSIANPVPVSPIVPSSSPSQIRALHTRIRY